VYLSWDVPNCASGCPDTWVGDGYCDNACNASACNWDGGDCINATGNSNRYNYNRGSGTTSHSSTSTIKPNYCTTGCPSNWLGDKVCDKACKNVECGFDLGDCGPEILYENIPGIVLREGMEKIVLSYDTNVFYLNLSDVFSEGATIVEASHDQGDAVHSVIIVDKHKIMAVALKKQEEPKLEELDKGKEASTNSASKNGTNSTTVTDDLGDEEVVQLVQVFNFLITGKSNETHVEADFNVTRLLYRDGNNTDASILSGNELSQSGENTGVYVHEMAVPTPEPTRQPTTAPTTDPTAALPVESTPDPTPEPTLEAIVTKPNPKRKNKNKNKDANAKGKIKKSKSINVKKLARQENKEGEEDEGEVEKEKVGNARRLLMTLQAEAEEENDTVRVTTPEGLANLLSSVEVEGVPVLVPGATDVLLKGEWGQEDYELADYITNQKQKQLVLMQLEATQRHHERLLQAVEDEFGKVARNHALAHARFRS
jgi:hypothetical protein